MDSFLKIINTAEKQKSDTGRIGRTAYGDTE